MEIAICSLERKLDHHKSRMTGQHVQIHGLGGGAPEEVTCSVCLCYCLLSKCRVRRLGCTRTYLQEI